MQREIVPSKRNERALARNHPLLSTEPEQAIQDMMSTIDTMRSIYVEETKALESSDPEGFFVIQGKKMETARRYQSSIIEILERKEEMRNIDPTLKERLESLYTSFSRDVEANKMALKRMQMTVDRLKKTINRATLTAATRRNAVSYSKSGALERDERKVLSTGINETA